MSGHYSIDQLSDFSIYQSLRDQNLTHNQFVWNAKCLQKYIWNGYGIYVYDVLFKSANGAQTGTKIESHVLTDWPEKHD